MNSELIFERFQQHLQTGDIVAQLRAGLIGEGADFTTPFGIKSLIYADYTASGRSLAQVEDFVSAHVLPFYANAHTESSFCGAYTTQLREQARSIIAKEVNAGSDCSVIFTGSGATSAVNRMVALSGVTELAAEHKPSRIGKLKSLFGGARVQQSQTRPTVFVGPYEHHSNILPWRESGAEVVEINEADEGGPDLAMLERELKARAASPLLIGAFSAASNVSGIITDVNAVTCILKQHGALAIWDYAGGGPYLDMDMNPDNGPEIDAIFLSPHKFPGGPGASGLLVVRNSAVRSTKPTWPGGGSVSYVSPWAHDYHASIVEREEAGTPNVIGDIRVALVFLVKAAIGSQYILRRDKEFSDRAMNVWQNNPNLRLLGVDKNHRLPIFSFAIRDDQGGYVHHQLFTRMLSDVYGIQVRGGCVCAGPYGHRLLGVERAESERIRALVQAGQEVEKPGWVRLNFGYLMDDKTVDFIIDSVDHLANNVGKIAQHYFVDDNTAQFHHQPESMPVHAAEIERSPMQSEMRG